MESSVKLAVSEERERATQRRRLSGNQHGSGTGQGFAPCFREVDLLFIIICLETYQANLCLSKTGAAQNVCVEILRYSNFTTHMEEIEKLK